MSAEKVQKILFFFSLIILITGIFLVVNGDKSKTAIITVFTIWFLITIVAAVNPYEIVEITYGQFHLKRHRPGKEETDKSILLAVKPSDTKALPEEDKLINEAELRPDEKRSPVDYLNLATKAWREKKYDDALEYTHTGLNLNPAGTRVRATLINRVGSAYDDLKIPDLAIKYYKNSIEVDPDFSWPHYNLGNLYCEQKKYVEAEKEYKKAIELDSEDADPHCNLGDLYSEQKKYAEAEKEYKKAIELDSEDADPHCNLGDLYSEQKKYAEAEREYKKAIELDPNDASNIVSYANFLYYIQKKYDKAEELYKKAVGLDPNDAGKIGDYATFLSDIRKDYDNAEELYKKAIELDPNDACNISNYAKHLIARRETKDARILIQKAFKLNQDKDEEISLELWFYCYAIFFDEYKEAKDNIEALLKKGIKSIGWYLDDVLVAAKELEHPDYNKLCELAKRITAI
ncbi:MAG: tetratricopeptide repeat protein [Candidatus Scalindua sp.]